MNKLKTLNAYILCMAQVIFGDIASRTDHPILAAVSFTGATVSLIAAVGGLILFMVRTRIGNES